MIILHNKSRGIGRQFDMEKVVEDLKAQGKEVIIVNPNSLENKNNKGKAFSSKELINRLNLINGVSSPFEP